MAAGLFPSICLAVYAGVAQCVAFKIDSALNIMFELVVVFCLRHDDA